MAEFAATGVDDFTLDGVSKRAGVDTDAGVRDARPLLPQTAELDFTNA